MCLASQNGNFRRDIPVILPGVFFHYAYITLNGVWIAKAVSEIHRHETNRSLNVTGDLGLNWKVFLEENYRKMSEKFKTSN